MDNTENEEGFVMLSKVRAGHKREFQFALRSQHELGCSLGRFRARRPVVEPDPSKPSDGEVEESDKVTSGEERKRKVKVKGVPTTLMPLLETGVLEGAHVCYRRKSDAGNKGLAGVIKGTGILCFCDDCKGVQVVTATNFELHAGSASKRPTDYIHFRNGKSIRDVLNEIQYVKLDKLVVTIQEAISSSSAKSSVLSCNFKDAISEICVETTPLLSSSCAAVSSSQTPKANCRTSKRLVGPVSLQKPSSIASKPCSSSTKSKSKITRKDLGLHKLAFQNDILVDGTELGYFVHGKKCRSGEKQGNGILCECGKLHSPSQFEACAGYAARRKPYDHIYTSNGVSLHSLAITISSNCKLSTEVNDELCGICQGGGNLLCCDGCPRAFHLACIFLSDVPGDTWYCRSCEDKFRKEKFAERNPNAIAAGRVPGVDPMKEITNRCIRIVNKLDTQDTGCTLCRLRDFCRSGFGPRTVMICDQCDKEYHVDCLRVHNMQDLKELPVGNWFCCSDCEIINSALKELVELGEQTIPDSLVHPVKRKLAANGSSGEFLDIRWRVLRGKNSCTNDIRATLSKAISVFHERFDPIYYGELRQDLIPHMVYGRNMQHRDFELMHCAVLIVNSVIVSAAVFRVFAKEIAEIPLVATSDDCEGKGYFQCLYSCVEKFFEDLGLSNLLLPAAEETRSLWLNRFGFNVIPPEEFNELLKDYSVMTFDRTTMLRKVVADSRN